MKNPPIEQNDSSILSQDVNAMETGKFTLTTIPLPIAYATKDKPFFKDFKESFISLFLCTVGDLITGMFMGVFTGSLAMLPALIVLIPAAIGMRGNIFASFGSRLGTYLHTGQINPKFKSAEPLNQSITSSTALAFIMSIFLGILAVAVANAIGLKTTFTDMLLISIIAGILSAFLMLLFAILIAFLSYKHGWDPDNLTAPLITLVGDMLTLPLIFLSLSMITGFETHIREVLLIVLILVTTLPILKYSLSKKPKEYYTKIMKESLPILTVCGILGILSGTFLGTKIGSLITIPGLLILIPPFLEDGGAMGGILAARLSSMLHLGLTDYSIKPSKKILQMFLMVHLLGVPVFTLVGVFAYTVAQVMHIQTIEFPLMLFTTIVAGEVLIAIINLLTYYASILSFKKGIDPDNVTIPIITSVVDLLGVMCFIAVLVAVDVI